MTDPDTEPTLTVFRTFSTGEVIALFPLIPWDAEGRYCTSHQHVGQHGPACLGIVNTTRPATEAEAEPLRRELESLGYRIEVRQRIPNRNVILRAYRAALAENRPTAP